jgi:hydroxymethylpyrimidine pyrophosphatase-like HAD family hydrolase
VGVEHGEVTMRYRLLATDYDGTIATHGRVDEATIAALQQARAAGIKLLLVSGRELESLQRTFQQFELFDLMVLENGGLLYEPITRQEWPLCEPPPLALVEALRGRNVHPLSVGRVIVATFEPHDHAVLECIRTLGLEHQVIFNKGAVMVLPSGVNKASGLKEALLRIGIEPAEAVAVGDAENDHALLALCGVGAAVANALPALREHADYVCEADHGAGVAELIGRMLDGTLSPHPRPERLVEAEAEAARALADVGADVHPDA